jgi:thioredoxin-like negative regulator of GroEL
MEMIPIVDGLGEESQGKMSVFQLDAGQHSNAALQNQWGLRGHPSFAILDENNRVVQRFFGPQPESALRQAMDAEITNQ